LKSVLTISICTLSLTTKFFPTSLCALIKQKELPTGVKVEYWIPSIHIDGHSDKISGVLMLGYLSKAQREVGKNFVVRERVQIDMVKTDFNWKDLYAKIKESRKVNRPVVNIDGDIQRDEKTNEVITEEIETNWFADAEDDIQKDEKTNEVDDIW
jgi:hypothetical protein